MPVILEIETGPQSKRKSVLRSGQSLEVGRGEEADFSVPSDGLISRRHFQLAFTTQGAMLRDLGSTNGTFLNGERVAEAVVQDGNRIRAGNTTFLVRIPGALPATQSAEPQGSTAVASTQQCTPANPTGQPPDLPSARAGGSDGGDSPLPEPDRPEDSDTSAGSPGVRDAAPDVSASGAKPFYKRTIEALPLVSIRDPTFPLPVMKPSSPAANVDSKALQSVILEIVSRERAARRWQLRAHQTATVGCGANADFCVDADPAMSSIHFELATDADSCRIRDRQSHAGTYVNDLPIRTAVLYHRDRIRAGQTEFLVSIQGGRRRPADPEDRRGVEFVLDARPDPTCQPGCAPARCPSGLAAFRGLGPDPPPARVARLLARAAPLYAIVDFGRLALPVPPELTDRSLIFEGLPAELASESSPLLIADVEIRQFDALIEAGWGKDALVCFLSNDPKAKVLERLRELSRCALPLAEQAPDGAALGFCWPSVLELLLRHTPPGNAERLLDSCEAYFLEAKPAATWQVFARQGFSATLAGLGFIPYRQADRESK